MNKKELKQIRKSVDRSLSERKLQRDEEKRAVINMTVKNDDGFLSQYSEDRTPMISEDVSTFIENSVSGLVPSESLTLRIHSDCIDDEEKAEYKNAIKEYYTKRYVSDKRELRRNTLIALLLAAAGIIALFAAIIVEIQTDSPIWTEVVDIIAWVLIWEAVDIMVFRNRELRVNCLRYLAFISMKVEYYGIS
ncbi:MAG: hypothetical protein E7634_01575 [Ruminococcaceae bacterium]|nr:hypothetical protein [Oscillospiraceae bacterium]